MKKITLLTTGMLCAASMVIGASASGVIEKIQAELRPDFEIVYEGSRQSFKNVDGEEVYPILYEGSTYLPIRAVSEMINKEVTWYEADKRIEISDAPELTVTDADNIVTEDTADNKSDRKPSGNGGTPGMPERGNGPDRWGDSARSENAMKPEKGEKPEKPGKDDDEDVVYEVNISEEEAKKIALEKAGLDESEVKSFKLELDDGLYEIEFKTDAKEYECRINPEDGAILEWEIDD